MGAADEPRLNDAGSAWPIRSACLANNRVKAALESFTAQQVGI